MTAAQRASIVSAYGTAVLKDLPAAYYRLGDAGPVAADSSGKGKNGTYAGLGAGLTQATAGIIYNDPQKSTTWSGRAGAYVSAPRDAGLESASAVTIETWLKIADANAFQSIVEYGDNSKTTFKGFGLKLDPANHGFAFKVATVSGTGTRLTLVRASTGPGANVATGSIHHVVGTYDGASVKLYVDGVAVATAATSGKVAYDLPANNSGFVIGNNQSAKVAVRGSLQEVALYTAALTPASIQSHYSAGFAPPVVTSVSYTDWPSFGYDLQRTSYNPNETTIGTNNASSLHKLWSLDLGEKIDATPVLAKAVTTPSGIHNLLYIGAENGKFYAIDADTGATVWTRQLGTYGPGSCYDLGGSPFGITGSAAFDRTTSRVYVADGQDNVYALNMSDGTTVLGWPVSLGADVTRDHAYSGVVLNPANGTLYAATASYCDFSPWKGRLAAIDTLTATLTNTFFPAASQYGGSGSGRGIWGPGAAAIDPASSDVFVVTGNGDGGTSESSAYSEHVVPLDAGLTTVRAANYPQVQGGDVDFGATPTIFTPAGCPAMVAAKNKSGILVQWKRDDIPSGPVGSVVMAPLTVDGNFIGAPAFSPGTNLLYVSDWENGPRGGYVNGMNALSVDTKCVLHFRWGTAVNTGKKSGGNQPTSSPAVGNGVVYFGAGLAKTVYAFNAQSGALLWSSGSTIGGSAFAAPIIDGHLYVGSWDHKLYAFGV